MGEFRIGSTGFASGDLLADSEVLSEKDELADREYESQLSETSETLMDIDEVSCKGNSEIVM